MVCYTRGPWNAYYTDEIAIIQYSEDSDHDFAEGRFMSVTVEGWYYMATYIEMKTTM